MESKKNEDVYYCIRYLFLDEEEERRKVEEWSASLQEVEATIDYKFKNKGLLRQALTHPSYHSLADAEKKDYETLEFQGDAVLKLIMTTKLIQLYPESEPGVLTPLTSANVDNEKLARVAVKHGLHHYLRHRAPQLQKQIQEFKNDILKYPLHSYGCVDTPKFLADIIESLIGAVYNDCCYDYDTVKKIFEDFLEPTISLVTLEVSPITELSEFSQKNKIKIKFVETSEGDDNGVRSAKCNVMLGSEVIGTATCSCGKDAVKKRAAKAALNYLKKP